MMYDYVLKAICAMERISDANYRHLYVAKAK